MITANSKNRPNKKENTERSGDTLRTSSQGRKESSGGGKAKKVNDEANKNIKARKF